MLFVLRFLLSLAVGVIAMVCAPVAVVAFCLLGLPALTGLYVLQRCGVEWARNACEWWSDAVSAYQGDGR